MHQKSSKRRLGANNKWVLENSEFSQLHWCFGRKVSCDCPPNTGSLYFNYKKTFSIVLLALVDAQYKFTVVDIGAFGKNSDGGILSYSNFGKALEKN